MPGSIPISGTAFLGADPISDYDQFTFSGPGLTIFSNPPASVSFVILSCKVSEICGLGFNLFGTSSPGYSAGSVDGNTANVVNGIMSFSGAAFVPVPFNNPLIAPVTVAGHVTGLHFDS